LQALILENTKTDKLHWWVDIHGRSGKSTLVAELRENPKYNVLYLQLETLDRFKKLFVEKMKQHKKLCDQWPSAIIIDCARNEEKSNLHDLYEVFERINDGIVQTAFYGVVDEVKYGSGLPVHIFANAAPIYTSMSPTRWAIYAISKIEKEEGKKDFFCFKAQAYNELASYSTSSVNWRPKVVTTVPQVDDGQSHLKTTIMLMEMWDKHKEIIEKNGCTTDNPNIIKKEWASDAGYDITTYKDGRLLIYGATRSAVIQKVPESILRDWTKQRYHDQLEPKKTKKRWQ